MGSATLIKHTIFFSAIAFATLLTTPAAATTITEYTDQSSFDEAAGALLVDTFGTATCFQISAPINSATFIPVCAYSDGTYIDPGEIEPGVTYSATFMSSSEPDFNIDTGGGFPGNLLDALLGTPTDQDALTATFSNPVSAAGFLTGYDVMGSAFNITFSFTDGSQQTLSNISIPDFDAIDYFGFTSSATNIASVTVQGSSNSTAFSDFAFSQESGPIAPEPAMLAPAGLLLIGLYARLFRRKREQHVAGNSGCHAVA